MSFGPIRIRLTALMIACIAVLGWVTGCGSTEASGEPHRIGVILSLQGVNAGIGEAERSALTLEAKRINASGGIDGRPIELLFEDDASDATRAIEAASRLIEERNVVAVIGPSGTAASMAIRNDVDRSAVPQVTLAGGAVLTDDFDEYVFRTAHSDAVAIPFILDYMAGRGFDRIGLLTDTSPFGSDARAIALARLPKAGLELAEDQTFDLGDTDMSEQLSAIKDSGAQAILLWTSGKEAAIVADNGQEAGIDSPIVGGPANGRAEFITGAASAAEGFAACGGRILSPASIEDEADRDLAEDFIQRYSEEYGAPPNTFAGYAYDALHLIAAALNRLPDEFTPANLRDEIENTSDFAGISGTYTFSTSDHDGLSVDDLVMYRVENGGWVLQE